MKLTINSTNIALWAEGELTAFSQGVLEDFERSDLQYFKHMQAAGSRLDTLLDYCYSDDFPFDDQLRLLSILNIHSMMLDHFIHDHPSWKRVLTATSGLMSMQRFMPGKFSLETFGIIKQDSERTVTLPEDLDAFVDFPQDNNLLAMSLSVTRHAREHQESFKDTMTHYQVLGHMAYHYAQTGQDVIDWNAACIIASVADRRNSENAMGGLGDLTSILREARESGFLDQLKR